jgi:hypothetical protein
LPRLSLLSAWLSSRARDRVAGMATDEELGELQTVVDDIAAMHDARVDKHELDDGTWVVSIEHDDWAITGSGFTEAQALSDLIQNARAEGRAP